MDWGLFDKNAGENTFLREEIVYPQKVCTKSACIYLKKKKKNQTQKQNTQVYYSIYPTPAYLKKIITKKC